VPLQSRYTVNASAQYTRTIVDHFQGFVRTDVSCKGTLYWYADNQITRPPLQVVNTKIGMRHDSWEVNIFASNIFNKTYDAFYFDNKFVSAPGGFNFAYLADDRRFGVEGTYRFGRADR
jgi:iron complex outermembrane receptor protein